MPWLCVSDCVQLGRQGVVPAGFRWWIWHACRGLFGTTLKWFLIQKLVRMHCVKKLKFVFTCKVYVPIVLLVFWSGKLRQKRRSLWELNLMLCLLRKDDVCRDVAARYNFLTMKTELTNRAHWVDSLFCPQRPEWSWILPSHSRVDCNTAQWETHLQVRNKEVCFAYQLLTTSRVAFGCCLWYCRCMPSCGSMVMGPFPRKLHWNILTVTFA